MIQIGWSDFILYVGTLALTGHGVVADAYDFTSMQEEDPEQLDTIIETCKKEFEVPVKLTEVQISVSTAYSYEPVQ